MPLAKFQLYWACLVYNVYHTPNLSINTSVSLSVSVTVTAPYKDTDSDVDFGSALVIKTGTRA